MASVTLNDAQVRAFKRLRFARDAKLKGLGDRALPSSTRRYFLHCQHRGERIGKIVGDAAAMNANEACARAVAMLAANSNEGPVPASPEETVFEAGAADRLRPVLLVIMREAERMGFRVEGCNLCGSIRLDRRKGRKRFL